MNTTTRKVIEEALKSKKRMLTDFQNPEYIKLQGMISRDNIPLEEKIKFIINNLTYEISDLEEDLN